MKHLAGPLKSQVKIVEAALGRVIAEAEGKELYDAVERVRRKMVEFRNGGESAKERALRSADLLLKKFPIRRRAAFAKAYTLYLELVNISENAYRTHRLKKRPENTSSARANLVYVLTAHPTESRSPENIELLRRLQALFLEAYDAERAPRPKHLEHLLHLLWRVGTHPRHKPTVADEARHIFSLIDETVLEEILRLRREGHIVRLRTWVGGDKDGHPGVGPAQTAASLTLSRRRLLSYLLKVLAVARRDAALLGEESILRRFKSLDFVRSLEKLGDGDGAKINKFYNRLKKLDAAYRIRAGARHPQLERCLGLFEIFPALVVPLELREERGLFGPGSVIARMMRYIKRISAGGCPQEYARGVVVSMTETAADLLEAEACVRHIFGRPAIPVIALFETPEVLQRSVEILDGAYKRTAWRKMIRARGKRLEVMLGYSDTAKRMGSFPSRLAVGEVMKNIGDWGKKKGVGIIFFHGSGGSEGRGGGSIREQACAWPSDALGIVKKTIQGEMVERTFASAEILRSQVYKIAEVQAKPPARRMADAYSKNLAERAAAAFAAFVSDEALKDFLAQATPYSSLNRLTIGSRPSRRSKRGGIESLRAIPWVLCWTQTRFMLPVWFGLGTAWRHMRKEPGAKRKLRSAMEKDPLLRGFMRLLGFAISKSEPRIFREYVKRLAPNAPAALLKTIFFEAREVSDLARTASPEGLLADREWLKESIFYRAPMIHPLNLLQIQTLRKKTLTPEEESLFRETVTGIAAGMLTTG